MLLLLIFLISFIAGIITLLFSFGLNIILIPVLSIFIPIDKAIALTSITFLFYNSIRLSLTWKNIDWGIVLKFTPLAVIGTVIGGILLNYALLIFNTKVLKVSMGVVLLVLILLEFFKILHKLKLKDNIFIFCGGFISGLAGGLTGFQGPFRVAALLNLNLNYQMFLATNTVLGAIIDFSRVIVYFFTFLKFREVINPILITTILGSILGFFLLFKVTQKIKIEQFKTYILGFIVILIIFMMLT